MDFYKGYFSYEADAIIISEMQKSNAFTGTKAAHCSCTHLFSDSSIRRNFENVNKNFEIHNFTNGENLC